jgi:heme exporter protein D
MMGETGMESFLAMGGYGAFVWPAYGLTALVLIALAGASLRSLRRSQAALDALERDGPARRARR